VVRQPDRTEPTAFVLQALTGACTVVALVLLAACGGTDGGASVAEDTTTLATDTTDEVFAPDGPEGGGGESGATTGELEAASDELLDDLAEDEPGCAAAVLVGDELVWTGAAGMADLDDGQPIDDDTVFDIGSVSKTFTATLVLLLAEQGEIDLDAPLSDVLGDLPPWADEITADQLLHHTSGVPDYIDLLYDEGFDDADRTTDQDALAALAAVDELEFEPGSEFAYSNSGYFLLAEVVDSVTGQDFAEVAADELFAPYDLAAEVDPLTDDPAKAISYVPAGDDWEVADSRWEQVGDGGIQSGPDELVTWAAELWDPQIGEEVGEVRLEDPEPVPGEGAYGAGVFISDDPELGRLVGHDGAWAGFVADLLATPEHETAVAATCNTPAHDPASLTADLLEIWVDS